MAQQPLATAMESQTGLLFHHKRYCVRYWVAADRENTAQVVRQCLESYGIAFERQGTHVDTVQVEDHYLRDGRGQFWVVVDKSSGRIVGTSAFWEVEGQEVKCVEIRKMYLLPEARGIKLGRALLEVKYLFTYLVPA